MCKLSSNDKSYHLITQSFNACVMQWLVFRRDGSITAAAWAQKAAEATASNNSVGDGEFMDMFEPQRRLHRRQAFIRSILRQTMQVGSPLYALNACIRSHG